MLLGSKGMDFAISADIHSDRETLEAAIDNIFLAARPDVTAAISYGLARLNIPSVSRFAIACTGVSGKFENLADVIRRPNDCTDSRHCSLTGTVISSRNPITHGSEYLFPAIRRRLN